MIHSDNKPHGASATVAEDSRSVFATVIWVVAVALHAAWWLALNTLKLAPLFNDSMHRFGPGCDFFAVYQAGYSAVHGESIFTFIPGHTVIPYAYPFRYLPIVAYTLGPLLNLTTPTRAYSLWLGLCELCLLYNANLTYRRSGAGLRGTLLAVTWLVFAPFFLELWVGQFTFFLGSFLFWTVLSVEGGHERRGVGWWLLSVLYKPAALLWTPIWLRERRTWWVVAVCALLLLANGIYFRMHPADWAVFLDANVQQLPTWHAGNVGLSGLLYQFTNGGAWFGPIRSALTVALVGPVLWATFRRRAPFWLLAALWTLLYYLVYKDVWEHHLTMLLPFLVLALMRRPTPLTIACYVLLALPSPFVFYDIPNLAFNDDPQPYFSTPVSILHHAWRVVPLLALYAQWLAFALQPRSAADEPEILDGRPEPVPA